MEKKKKINIIDVAVILLLILAVAVVGVKLMGDKVQDAVDKKVDCWAEVVIVGAQPRIFDEIFRQDLVGEKMVAGNAFIDATIEDVWLEDYVTQIPTATGETVDSLNPTEKDIVVLIHTMVSEGAASPKIGSQEVRAGMTFIVKTQTFASTGTIRYVELGDYTNPYNHE